MQARAPERRRDVVSYYFRNGPIGLLITSRQRINALHSVAVVGLGSGTLACYAQPNESWTFYEIDPAVRQIALDARWFTFVRDCAPSADIVLGDARLSLARAQAAGYDMIILDAYSSDAIPVHLITREALELYRSKLAPSGTIVFHISNLYFDLAPVVSALAADAGMVTRRMHDSPIAESDEAKGKWSSEWMAVARDTADFGVLMRDQRWVPDSGTRAATVWTDDFSSTLSALKRK
jgi:spermidine synthase